MKIVKVLNNNSVLALNEHNDQVILIGPGIGFKRKHAETIILTDHMQQFVLANHKLTQQMLNTLEKTPVIYFEIVTQIIQYAQKVLKVKLNDGLIFTLIDHLSFTIERFQKGIVMTNALLWDIRKIYKKEFQIGKYAITLMNEKLSVQMNDDEAAFIAMHIINAEMSSDNDSKVDQMMEIINGVMKIIAYHCSLNLDPDSLVYTRLMNHLKFFAQRILMKEKNQKGDSSLLNTIKSKYEKAYSVSMNIKKFVEQHYLYTVSEEEILYLSIHIQRVLDSVIE